MNSIMLNLMFKTDTDCVAHFGSSVLSFVCTLLLRVKCFEVQKIQKIPFTNAFISHSRPGYRSLATISSKRFRANIMQSALQKFIPYLLDS